MFDNLFLFLGPMRSSMAMLGVLGVIGFFPLLGTLRALLKRPDDDCVLDSRRAPYSRGHI